MGVARVFVDTKGLVEKLEEGKGLSAERKGRGKLAEEEDLEVFGDGHRLLSLKVFHGREPHYYPWAELFTVSPGFFGSPFEGELLGLLAEAMPPGGRVFVEYEKDGETKEALMAGVPAPATRLGRLLFERGFTWFKDWYFAEGFKEGDVKLQGEKPAGDAAGERHAAEARRELERFLNSPLAGKQPEAAERAREIISGL